jgi:hypothetical protein
MTTILASISMSTCSDRRGFEQRSAQRPFSAVTSRACSPRLRTGRDRSSQELNATPDFLLRIATYLRVNCQPHMAAANALPPL